MLRRASSARLALVLPLAALFALALTGCPDHADPLPGKASTGGNGSSSSGGNACGTTCVTCAQIIVASGQCTLCSGPPAQAYQALGECICQTCPDCGDNFCVGQAATPACASCQNAAVQSACQPEFGACQSN